MSLIDKIDASLGTINWADTEHHEDKIFAGLVLGKYGVDTIVSEINYYNGLGTVDGYAMAGLLRMIADVRGLSSTDLDNATKNTLTGTPFFSGKHLPINNVYQGENKFHVFRWGVANSYRLAKLWNYELAKWNANLAWQEFKACCQSIGDKGVWCCDPTVPNGLSILDRFYDENAESIDVLLGMYEVDKANNKGALEYARDVLWSYVNTPHWDVDHYDYCPSWKHFECEGAFFHMIFCRLMALNGYSLVNWDRVLTDMKTRYLNNGWDSPQWTYGTTRYYCVIHKHEDNSQRRLPNTVGAWRSLHSFYQVLDATAKSNFRSLLDGTEKGWSLMLANSTLFDSGTNRFRWYNDTDVNDPATSQGVLTLFLMGIVPQTGSLFLPIYEFLYECRYSLDSYVKFDYTARTIRIPVATGEIKFIYGATPVSYTFNSDGVYDIVFGTDWTTISSVTKIGDLDGNLIYTRQPWMPPTHKATTLTLTLTRV